MKIAVSASGEGLDASIDPRFGRCAYFIVLDLENMNFEAFSNENIALGGGAGIQSAQFIASKGAEIVITGNCGPNAVKTLNAAGVKIIVGQSGTVREAVEKFKSGALNPTTDANVTDHYGVENSGPGGKGSSGRGNSMGSVGGMGLGRGMGRGGGMGRGMGCGKGMGGQWAGSGSPPPNPAPTLPLDKEQEISQLRDLTRNLRKQIEDIETRIENLQKP